MALHESALEEFGLAPMWVRRGMGQASDGEAASAAAAPETAVATPAADVSRVPQSLRQETVPAERVEADPRSSVRQDDLPPRPPERGTPAATPRAPAARPEQTVHTARSDAAASSAPPDDDFAWFDDLPSQPPSGAPLVPAEARAKPSSVDSLDWDALAERVAGCQQCRLCEKRTNTVFGVGDRNADWMLIGEAPGENEDRQGEPFVGQAGKLLDNMLRSLTLARDTNVYIANVIKCRPPGNRNPEPDEVMRCEPYLQRQVALVKPKLIVALGRFAAQSLLKTDASISSLRGRVHTYEGVPVIVSYHPAYLLRSLADKSKAWADLCLARDTWLKAAETTARTTAD
jgi:uracil-DNA glycosylase